MTTGRSSATKSRRFAGGSSSLPSSCRAAPSPDGSAARDDGTSSGQAVDLGLEVDADVATGTTVAEVDARATVQRVVTLMPEDEVIAGITGEEVVACETEHAIIAIAAGHPVV